MTDAQAIHELVQAGLAEPASDESFDRFARLVHRQLGVASALVTLVLDDEAVLPGAHGLPEPYQSARRTPRSHTFCQFVASEARPLVVEDARTVPHLATLRAVDDIGVVAYAGFPIFDPQGRAVGSLCAFDPRPRTWSDDELATLADLASACTSELRLRLARARARRMQRVALAANKRSRLLLELSESFAAATSVRDVAERLAAVGAAIGARYAGLALLDGGGTRLEFTTLDHLEPGSRRRSAACAWTRTAPRRPRHGRASPCSSVTTCSTASGSRGRVAHRARHGRGALVRARPRGRPPPGVVALAWDTVREFDDDAVKTETTIASYVAHAVERVRLLEERHRVAATLQAAMLTELPPVRGAELAATYASATRTDQVGGDWYDAVVLDDDACVLMIGDVTGHDMRAAAQMGQLRSMLRTFAWCQDEPPAVLLRLLDRANRGSRCTPARRPSSCGSTAPRRGSTSRGRTPGTPHRSSCAPTGRSTRFESAPDLMLGCCRARRGTTTARASRRATRCSSTPTASSSAAARRSPSASPACGASSASTRGPRRRPSRTRSSGASSPTSGTTSRSSPCACGTRSRGHRRPGARRC